MNNGMQLNPMIESRELLHAIVTGIEACFFGDAGMNML
jgi:hypothetical protein